MLQQLTAPMRVAVLLRNTACGKLTLQYEGIFTDKIMICTLMINGTRNTQEQKATTVKSVGWLGTPSAPIQR
jgi:hypothetical protein